MAYPCAASGHFVHEEQGVARPFTWRPTHVAAADSQLALCAPVIARGEAPKIALELDVWDHWPVLEEDGAVADINGGQLVIALSAPVIGDPEARHDMARARLLHRSAAGWRDLGRLFPNGFTAGSREWAGSAVVDPSHRRVTLHFTAVGRAGDHEPGFHQRIFETSASLIMTDGAVMLENWTEPDETIRPDGLDYETDLSGGGAVGTIKAFRDPFQFRDRVTGEVYLLFTGSRAGSDSPWNGLIGLAQRGADGWKLLPPVVDAVGLNNELERPHIIVHDGRCYLFWSTQRKVFATDGPTGPDGLYGVVSETPFGPWRPINGSGLVIANPAQAPFQAYSWQVLADLSVWSFANLLELDRPPRDPVEARAHFGGAPAPVLRLALDGDRASLA